MRRDLDMQRDEQDSAKLAMAHVTFNCWLLPGLVMPWENWCQVLMMSNLNTRLLYYNARGHSLDKWLFCYDIFNTVV